MHVYIYICTYVCVYLYPVQYTYLNADYMYFQTLKPYWVSCTSRQMQSQCEQLSTAPAKLVSRRGL